MTGAKLKSALELNFVCIHLEPFSNKNMCWEAQCPSSMGTVNTFYFVSSNKCETNSHQILEFEQFQSMSSTAGSIPSEFLAAGKSFRL